jgi:hypothetical protein
MTPEKLLDAVRKINLVSVFAVRVRVYGLDKCSNTKPTPFISTSFESQLHKNNYINSPHNSSPKIIYLIEYHKNI